MGENIEAYEEAARQAELDLYEARFGKYVQENGPFGMLGLKIGVQRFPIHWEDDPAESSATNAAERRWFKRMLCCALHHLIEAETHKDEGLSVSGS